MPRKGFQMPSEEQIKRGIKPRKNDNARKGTAHAKKTGAKLCGAKRKGKAGKCTMAAGWGTSHPGSGRCKLHGGSTPNQIKAAATEEYRTLLGKPMEINPYDALLWCIRIRAGEVDWLSHKMSELEEKDWTEDTLVGKQFHLFARERASAMNDLARYSQMAISLGIDERRVRLMEAYGETLGRLIKGILEELGLTPEQMAAAPGIVRKHMILVSSGMPDALTAPPGQAQLPPAAAA